MLETYFIYIGVLFILVMLLYFEKKYPIIVTTKINFNIPFWGSLFVIIFTLTFGLRYDVGTDYLGYVYDYNTILYGNSRYELGYWTLNVFLKKIDAHYSWIFLSTTFIQILFFYLLINKLRLISVFAIYFYFTSLYLLFSINGVRQAIAFSIFIFSIRFISERKMLKYFVAISVAFLFHYSSLLLLPLYFILNKNIFSNRIVQYVLVTMTFLFSSVFLNLIWNNFQFISSLIGYNGYADQLELVKNLNIKGGFGLSSYLFYAFDIILIFCSVNLKNEYRDYYFVQYYNVYLIGVLLNNVAGQSLILSRFIVYFINFKIVVFSFFCYYLFSTKYNRSLKISLGLIILVSYFLFYILAINNNAGNCAPYKFVFNI